MDNFLIAAMCAAFYLTDYRPGKRTRSTGAKWCYLSLFVLSILIFLTLFLRLDVPKITDLLFLLFPPL